eukprot:11362291-Prorocentrum_lima.AAC.1
MTSSLVGSEMCIRDRVEVLSWCLNLRSVGMRGGVDPKYDFHRSRDWRAVSYTHLTLPTICSV